MSTIGFQFEPLKNDSIVVELTQRLIQYLFSGSLKPGDKLPAERQLSEALGVGRSSLREALKTLTVLGLVEVRQGDGTYLRKGHSRLLTETIEWGLLLSERQTMHLIEARQKIEAVLAGLAAEKCNKKDAKELELILLEMQQAGSNFDSYTEADIKFHMKLYEIAGNSVLENILISIQSLLRTWINTVVESAGDTDFSYNDHVHIYKAVVSNNSVAATAAMEKHMFDAGNRLKSVISEAETMTFNSDKE